MDLITSLPVHILVIHAVVVLVPLAAIGACLVIFIPKLRPAYTPLVFATIAISVITSYIATESGEALSERVGLPLAHAEYGERLFRLVLLLAILFTAWFLIEKRTQLQSKTKTRLTTTLKVLISIAAIGCLILTVLTGHSGAKASWGQVPDKISSR